MDSQMHINLSKQTLADELGEPGLIQQITCTADISSTGVTAQVSAHSWKIKHPEPRREILGRNSLGQRFVALLFGHPSTIPPMILITEKEGLEI